MPLDVDELNVDMLSATSRKFLRGPRGMGCLYVREELIAKLEPPLLDMHAATWTAPDEYRLVDDARRFENWECNVAAKIAFGTAVNYALDWGMDAIESRISGLAGGLREGLGAMTDVSLRDLGTRQCGIVSFTVAHLAPPSVVQSLRERGINASVSRIASTRLNMHARGLDSLVRAAVHYYNSEDEVTRFLTALEEIVR
jgi:cysteine desulfurase/selenocysteine lyase